LKRFHSAANSIHTRKRRYNRQPNLPAVIPAFAVADERFGRKITRPDSFVPRPRVCKRQLFSKKPGCRDCGHSSSSHLRKAISVTRARVRVSPAPVLLTNKTKLLHLIELKDCRVKAGRRKCARGYVCPRFAGRRVPFDKSLNGCPDPHIGSPLPTLTMQQGERHRVQSVLAPRVGCPLGLSVAAHPSAATCSYNSLLLSLRSVTSEPLYLFPLAPKTGHV
jgi:hypothetical protein